MMTQGAMKICAVPLLIMAPQLGVGGCAPRPKKPSVASRMMPSPIASMPTTMTGATAFGSRWREQDMAGRGAEIDGRLEIGLALQLDDLRAGEARELRQIGDADGKHRAVEAGADDGDQDQRDQDVGKRPGQVDDGRHRAFEQAAEIAGGGTERHAERPSRWRWP